MIKKGYESDIERADLLNALSDEGKILIEDARHTDENYLLFVGPDETEPYVLETPPPGPSQDDYMVDLDYRMCILELGL